MYAYNPWNIILYGEHPNCTTIKLPFRHFGENLMKSPQRGVKCIITRIYKFNSAYGQTRNLFECHCCYTYTVYCTDCTTFFYDMYSNTHLIYTVIYHQYITYYTLQYMAHKS